jgi:energy-coupling factor transport system ATP-binding protein
MIEICGLHYVYRSPFFPEHRALSGVSFTIEPGEMVAVVGASGSGKTTLIQHLNGLLLPTSGSVRIQGQDLSESKANLSAVRRKVGLVFQFPEFQLFEETVERDVAFGLKSFKLSERATRRRVRCVMEMVGLDWRTLGKRPPFHLSGGEKRRAALAGILVMEPEVLVLDEPTAGLDWDGTRHVEDILQACHRSGRTVVFVSHDMDLVARLADRVIVLSRGKVVYDGGKKALFSRAGVLKEAGLTLPHVVRFMRMIRRKGVPVRTDVFTVQEAKKEIRRVLRANPKYRKYYKF